MNPIRWVADGMKALGAMVHSRARTWSLALFPDDGINYAREVGDGLNSNVLMAPVQWVARAFLEGRLAVAQDSADGDEVLNFKHPLLDLLRKPLSDVPGGYTGSALMKATIYSLLFDGNAYWIKVRGTKGKPGELWYVPHWMMTPKGDEANPRLFITHYEYRPGNVPPLRLEPDEVVHLRDGLDPRDPRRGLSALGAVLREVYTDDEAGELVAALMRNKGIPGLIITPKDGVSFSETDKQATKDYVEDRFTGRNRFKPMVLGGATSVQQLGFNPEELNLSAARNLPEERVCAALGIPAAVVGFGTGLEQTKVGATMQEMRKQAWSDCILPLHRLVAEELDRNLGADFNLQGRLAYDTSDVDALQDDLNKRDERLDRGVRGGWMTVADARRGAGLEVRPQDEVYLRGIGVIEVTTTGEEVVRGEPAAQPGAGPEADAAAQAAASGAKAAKRLTRQQARIVRAMDRLVRRGTKAVERRLVDYFKAFGESVEAAWKAGGAKADEDELRIETLFSQMDMPRRKQELRGLIGAHYVSIHNEVLGVMAGLGVATNLPDAAQLGVLARGGTRAGLIDLEAAGRARALEVVRAGREAGLGVDEIARNLRDAVPAGPWSSSATRSQVIARTETRYAQTTSALMAYRTVEGVDRVLMLDGRLGETDEECEQMNGHVATFAEAEQLLAAEHPNGTRDLVPIFGEPAAPFMGQGG